VAEKGALEITGYDPTVGAEITVTSGLGTLEVTGYDPAVVLVVPTTPGLGTLEITGYEPTVTATSSTDVDLFFKWKDSSGHVRSREILVESKIDHTQLQNIGTNAHTVIDDHLASTADPHEVTAAQAATDTGSYDGILSGADDSTQKALDTIDDLTVTYKQLVCLAVYLDVKERAAEWNFHGGISSLDTGSPLDTTPTDIVLTAGIGKLVFVVNAGGDLDGEITVTGDTVDRNTGAVTADDTDTITVDALSTDTSDADVEGNTRHGFEGAYITSKWFSGSVTLSTTDLTLTDVDTYQVSFEQWNDEPAIEILTLDLNAFAANTNAWGYGYLYSLVVTGDKCDIVREVSLEAPAAGIEADKYYRIRRGNLGISLDGSSDGFWVDFFPGPLNQNYWEDLNIKVWAEITKTAVLS